tara:strand:+ start:9502 stop:9924 length:423 start_codon:yes stop_codon:yes gene_type:complete
MPKEKSLTDIQLSNGKRIIEQKTGVKVEIVSSGSGRYYLSPVKWRKDKFTNKMTIDYGGSMVWPSINFGRLTKKELVGTMFSASDWDIVDRQIKQTGTAKKDNNFVKANVDVKAVRDRHNAEVSRKRKLTQKNLDRSAKR